MAAPEVPSRCLSVCRLHRWRHVVSGSVQLLDTINFGALDWDLVDAGDMNVWYFAQNGSVQIMSGSRGAVALVGYRGTARSRCGTLGNALPT